MSKYSLDEELKGLSQRVQNQKYCFRNGVRTVFFFFSEQKRVLSQRIEHVTGIIFYGEDF